MSRLRLRWQWVVFVLTIAYVALAWVYAAQTLSGRVKMSEIPAIEGVAEEPVTLVGGAIELDAGFYDNPADDACTVVMIHGVDDDRSSVLTFAPIYWELGCSLFAFDHRDHGRSPSAHRTYGFYEAQDAVLAIDWVIDRTGLSAERIGLHGISYGAATALEVLDHRDDLGFIVADSPYSSMTAIVSETANESLGFLEPLIRPLASVIIEQRANFQIGEVDPAAAVRGRKTPILVMHTAGDEIVPVEQSAAIALANPAVERHVLEADGGHLTAYGMRTGVYTNIVHEFLGRKAPQFVP